MPYQIFGFHVVDQHEIAVHIHIHGQLNLEFLILCQRGIDNYLASLFGNGEGGFPSPSHAKLLESNTQLSNNGAG